ncbi:centromere protein X isoform X1 [Neoarius graeffei]|uniref:centromere protein X isoform X1 n=1 Tax=Neoarius graeffei TaxID=443677 RepID=UPI00298D4701|nr:centromere protein X isoform X1 [Neoarius graeffei]
MAGQEQVVVFKKETVSKLLMQFFKDDKSKAVSNDTVSLMAEMLRIFVIEATRRTIKQAENEDCVGVDLEHVERILPQLAVIFICFIGTAPNKSSSIISLVNADS